MLLSKGAVEVQAIIQNIVPPPYYIDSKYNRAIENPLHFKPAHKLFRVFSQILILLILLPLMLYRLVWFFIYWNSYTYFNVIQVITYGITTCLMLVYVPVYFLFNNENPLILSALNKIFISQSSHFNNIECSFTLKIPILGKKSFEEIFMYFFSFSFFLIPPILFLAPFILPFLPLQLLFGSNHLVKFLAAGVYSCAGDYGSISVLSVLLLSVVYLEVVLAYSGLFYKQFINTGVNVSQQFGQCCKRYRSAQILLKLGNILCAPFYTNLIFIGISLATCCSYITLKHHNNKFIGLVVYLIGPVLATICFIVANFLTYLGSIPCKRSLVFKKQWASYLHQRVHKQLLRSCKPLSFELGPYGNVSAKLGIQICDDIIRNTVTVLLLGSV